MRIRVLGSCAAWPEPGRACTGFLVSDAGRHLVVDLGYGTAPRLFAALPVDRLDAVVLTHAHPDHMLDVHALLRARHYGFRGTGLPRLPVHAPAGLAELLAPLEGPDGPELMAATFDWHEYRPGGVIELGPLRVELVALPHYVPNAGVRVTGPGGVFAYTGDTGPDPAVARLGAAADLFAVDATFQDRPVSEVMPHPRYDLSAREAAGFATQAGARRLLLTHFWPGADRVRAAAEAAEHFAGPILVADEDQTIEVRAPEV
ncbi:MBL fold metallo-hydrolase [Actinocatenispora thailandica]|uniref:MBL fold metallo-hydrolase n=1 Tax=Actinocatenispora thailandica TaxID=227318 RepID=A0A7R7HWA1_9ACTN|nr:MBL fold metallo-hydrolase [Actinocatenispora thailandica]BCJ34867.1 MBL fold metallo-hydrolase [Actinocatenispora thailandica]